MKDFLTIAISLFVTLYFGWKLIFKVFPWLQYDIQLLRVMQGNLSKIREYGQRTPVFTTLQRLIELARDQPSKTFILFEDEKWTYRDVNNFSSQVARVLHSAGIGEDDSVSLMMTSCPQLVAVLYGIAKVAAISALINYNHRKKSLLNLIEVSKCKAIVISNEEDIVEAIEEIAEELTKSGVTIYVLGEVNKGKTFSHKSLHTLLEKESVEEVPSEWRKNVTLLSHFCYIYTSGTTGLPKASIMKHTRSWLLGSSMKLTGATENDIIYTPLPLHHTAGMYGVTGTLAMGCSMAIRRKFSASHFWEDCRKYKVTIIQYIGETLRYVVNQPPNENDRNHCVRAGVGNGVRPLVWKQFLARFGDIRLVEFYASTEGNCGFFNLDGHIGSVGLFSPLMKAFAPMKLVQYDRERDEVIRDSKGRCIDVPTGTPGLLIALITTDTAFHGYLGNKKQTEKKILRNVVKDGDAYFNSGDLMKRGKDYHMFFVDRIGDTFRWKGENVSTVEVADIMTLAPSIREANVYGVEIPGIEGRAGMMVVVLKDGCKIDCDGIYQYACSNLATYARPLFIRVKSVMHVTGTFKHIKTQLVEEGFEPSLVDGDDVYFLDSANGTYSILSEEVLSDIKDQRIRL